MVGLEGPALVGRLESDSGQLQVWGGVDWQGRLRYGIGLAGRF